MLAFAAAASTAPDYRRALDETVPAALDQLGGIPDLVTCFLSMDHAGHAEGIAALLSERTGCGAIAGCTAGAVIAGRRELEEGPALALWLARLPGVEVRPFTLQVVQVDEGYGITGWPPLESPDATSVLLFADPFTFPAEQFLAKLDEQQPGVAIAGGLASGGEAAGENRLLAGPEARWSGAVGVALTGPVRVRTVVSQGSRPVGSPFVVTRADGNVVHELGGQPAVARLRQLVAELPSTERALLLGGGIQVGQVIDERKLDFGSGDFLVRNLVGADEDSGAIALGDEVRLGQTLQFHLRDAGAADEDLAELLRPVPGWQPRGALLFSCNGRGRRFFGEPDHDARALATAAGNVPVAGFFAAGELGPIGGRNFLHGYTASVVVFSED